MEGTKKKKSTHLELQVVLYLMEEISDSEKTDTISSNRRLSIANHRNKFAEDVITVCFMIAVSKLCRGEQRCQRSLSTYTWTTLLYT